MSNKLTQRRAKRNLKTAEAPTGSPEKRKKTGAARPATVGPRKARRVESTDLTEDESGVLKEKGAVGIERTVGRLTDLREKSMSAHSE